jgi:osmotically-inducible protein OsmY
VRSYFQKQMAQEVVRRVEGVEQIDNDLEVLWV